MNNILSIIESIILHSYYNLVFSIYYKYFRSKSIFIYNKSKNKFMINL